MAGFFINGLNRDGNRKDFGFYTEERGVHDPSEMSQLVQDDKAYRVEVTEASSGVVIQLESDNRTVEAELEEKIERRSKGTNLHTYQETGDPVMPGEYDNPDNALSMYAEYALSHETDQGLEMEVEWGKVLDEENRGL